MNTVNGKRYIGQTIRELTTRKTEHVNEARKGSKFYIHLAINKYGEDVFEWSIIDVAESREELNEREVYWIDYYNTYKDGYNMTLGGQSFNSEEFQKGIENRSNNYFNNLRLKQDNHPFYIFDKYGKFIGESDNRLLFCAENNVLTGGASKVLRNQNPSIGYFVLIYIEDFSEENLKQRLKRIRYNRDFVVFNKEKQYIGTWQNQLCCERDLGLKRGCINKCLTYIVKIINGYYFYYLDECPEDLKVLIR